MQCPHVQWALPQQWPDNLPQRQQVADWIALKTWKETLLGLLQTRRGTRVWRPLFLALDIKRHEKHYFLSWQQKFQPWRKFFKYFENLDINGYMYIQSLHPEFQQSNSFTIILKWVNWKQKGLFCSGFVYLLSHLTNRDLKAYMAGAQISCIWHPFTKYKFWSNYQQKIYAKANNFCSTIHNRNERFKLII